MKSSDKNGAFFLPTKKAVLMLENGMFFKGKSLGFIGTTSGELCFNTGMVGYQEILTDPSYNGQIIMMTYPHIGNYGTNSQNTESKKIQASGFIVREECSFPSNYLSQDILQEYLINNKIVGIQDLDTRYLTRIIRDQGSMNAIISSTELDKYKLEKKLNSTPKMDGLNLAKKVSCNKIYNYQNYKKNKYKVVVIDFGVKENILKLLSEKYCDLIVVPWDTSFEKIKSFEPDGIFLSNGPGDPSAVKKAISCIKSLLGLYPIFGICLGHQLLGLALGAETFKLKYGHRGINHPVKNLLTNQVEITSQNHGFAISENNLPEHIDITHINLNDKTIAGIECKKYNIFSIQYHPESSPGPNDSLYLFNQFIKSMRNQNA